jgi:cupin 2 domain-containing protein
VTKATGNLFAGVPAILPSEEFTTLLQAPNVRIERIVSHGHASPLDFWYDQPQGEWVIVLEGSAGVLFEGEAAPRVLKRGDYLHIPPHARHRVAWTDRNEPTIWLAVHYS